MVNACLPSHTSIHHRSIQCKKSATPILACLHFSCTFLSVFFVVFLPIQAFTIDPYSARFIFLACLHFSCTFLSVFFDVFLPIQAFTIDPYSARFIFLACLLFSCTFLSVFFDVFFHRPLL